MDIAGIGNSIGACALSRSEILYQLQQNPVKVANEGFIPHDCSLSFE